MVARAKHACVMAHVLTHQSIFSVSLNVRYDLDRRCEMEPERRMCRNQNNVAAMIGSCRANGKRIVIEEQYEIREEK